jgi:8-oxo-dGTP diphosphatase
VPEILTIAALCIRNDDGELLLVRKRGTTKFMQPGGKLEPGESAEHAAVRELEEELGIRVTADELIPMGTWHGIAANEEETFIDAAVFACATTQVPVIAAEIEEMLWLDPARAAERGDLAPLLTEFVIPGLTRAAS